MELRHRCDLHLNDEVKKFLWIATLVLDPRFKKPDFFKCCEDLVSPQKRTSRYTAWQRIKYNKQHYKNKVSAPAEASGPVSNAAGNSASGRWHRCAHEAEERVRLIFQRPRKFRGGG